ncbi:MmcQ/YjbR family DNA-binding protein [Phytoactinopolyspora limicola]|uniref:MmcQ/YjbR family DNA-binding protein n=1 Tax=Phytoactinopolyspora limicola TaxID=2715536 RepID=UPI00140B2278|nr:MmcQ/YjbR family DNA-binding protein [Phytoactinopolyspora limicola]
MRDSAEVPGGVAEHLRSLCLRLPECVEEAAWVGTRWRVGTRTFAHVVLVDSGWPPAYARAVGADGPLVVLTFYAPDPDVEALSSYGPPFFRPPWAPNIMGVVLDPGTDWDDIAELLVESYRFRAPRRLSSQLEDPEP